MATSTGEPPLISAFRLARLRDRSMGQAEEIKALTDMLKASEEIMRIMNNDLLVLVHKKKGISREQKKLLINDALTQLSDALERFVDAKTARIYRFVDHFRAMRQDITEETKILDEFESEWDNLKRTIRDVKSNFMNSPQSTVDSIDNIKADMLQKGLPIVEKLNKLEDRMRSRLINMIAFIAQASTSVDTNELYRLFTDEP